MSFKKIKTPSNQEELFLKQWKAAKKTASYHSWNQTPEPCAFPPVLSWVTPYNGTSSTTPRLSKGTVPTRLHFQSPSSFLFKYVVVVYTIYRRSCPARASGPVERCHGKSADLTVPHWLENSRTSFPRSPASVNDFKFYFRADIPPGGM